MDNFINNLISQLHMFPLWGLILFSFASACIQQFFPPYPSEVLLLIFGGLAVTDVIIGPAAIVPYIIGTIVSSLFVFCFSRRMGKPLLKNRYVRKIFPRRNQRKAGLYMRKYGTPALAICKFLPGINTVCLIVGGVMGLHGIAPLITIVLAGIAENAVYYLAGIIIGNNMPSLYAFSKSFSYGAAIVGAAIIIILVLLKFRNRIFKKTGKAAH